MITHLGKGEMEGLKNPSLQCVRNQNNGSIIPSDTHNGNLYFVYTH